MVSRHLDDDIPPDGSLWRKTQQFSVDVCKKEITRSNEIFFLTRQKVIEFWEVWIYFQNLQNSLSYGPSNVCKKFGQLSCGWSFFLSARSANSRSIPRPCLYLRVEGRLTRLFVLLSNLRNLYESRKKEKCYHDSQMTIPVLTAHSM